jgi:hypothetical protein
MRGRLNHVEIDRFTEPTDAEVAWGLLGQLERHGPQVRRASTNGGAWQVIRFDELFVARAFLRLVRAAASPPVLDL